MLLPDGRQGLSQVRKLGNLEPLLHKNLWTVVMGRIDQLVGSREPYRIFCRPLQVATPPVGVAVELLYTLNNNQPVGVDSQDSLAHLLGCHMPVGAGIAITPGSRTMWLVGQVRPDDRLIVAIVFGQH